MFHVKHSAGGARQDGVEAVHLFTFALGEGDCGAAFVTVEAGKTCEPGTGSQPPPPPGRQRESREAARRVPRHAPWSSIASRAYAEQVGS
jgi:hypothetical protein